MQLAVEMALDQGAMVQAAQRALLFMRSAAMRHQEAGRKLETAQEVSSTSDAQLRLYENFICVYQLHSACCRPLSNSYSMVMPMTALAELHAAQVCGLLTWSNTCAQRDTTCCFLAFMRRQASRATCPVADCAVYGHTFGCLLI